MKFSYEQPPIYKKLFIKFGVDWEKGIAITYGDTVYSKFALTPDLVPHEYEHMKQQAKMGPEKWYEMYLNVPEFRLEQEVEAYRKQVEFLYHHVKDRNQRFSIKHRLYKELSGPMYGNLCTYDEARKLIG